MIFEVLISGCDILPLEVFRHKKQTRNTSNNNHFDNTR